MLGGSGADTFVLGGNTGIVMDYSAGDGDTLLVAVGGTDAAPEDFSVSIEFTADSAGVAGVASAADTAETFGIGLVMGASEGLFSVHDLRCV